MKKIVVLVAIVIACLVGVHFAYNSYWEHEVYRMYTEDRLYHWANPEENVSIGNLTHKEYDELLDTYEGYGDINYADIDWNSVTVRCWIN